MKTSHLKSSLFMIGACAVGIAGVYCFCDSNYLFNLLCQIMCYYIAVTGLNFITGMTGQPMLGMAGVFALGGYTSGLLTTRLGISPWLALPFVLLMGLIVGLLLGYPSLRVSGVYLSFTTIGFSEIVRILLNNMTSLTGGGTGLKDIPSFSVFGHTLVTMKEKFLLYACIAVLVALFANRIIHSKWGKSFIAVNDNIDAVPVCGINLTTVKVTAFCLTTMLGCLGGSLYVHMINYANPSSYSQTLSVTMLSMMIVGGMGSNIGCFIGTALVICLPELLRFLGRYYDLVYAIIVMLLILFMPCGLANIFRKKGRKISLQDLKHIFIGRT